MVEFCPCAVIDRILGSCQWIAGLWAKRLEAVSKTRACLCSHVAVATPFIFWGISTSIACVHCIK